MKTLKSYSLVVLCMLLVLPACKNDDMGGGDACNSDFDQKVLFQHLSDELIIPGYDLLYDGIFNLQERASEFVSNPTEGSLLELRSVYSFAYLTWQKAAQYEFGPAEEVFLRSSLNNFPLNVDVLKANIESEEYDFSQVDTYDKGFPALDYMLYGIDNDPNTILDKYIDDDALSAKRKAYLMALIADMEARAGQTLNAWNDTYSEFFVNNTGTAAGTSLSLLINNLNQHYELIKREKVGFPAGVLTVNIPNPDKVEAFYSGQSLDLAVAALEAAENLYLGRGSNGTNGPGLDNYLTEINAQKNGQALNDLIKAQFTTALTTLKALPAPLSETIENDNAAVLDVYAEITKQLVQIKTDMPSVLCVSITYIDNPSDSD